MTQDPTVKPPGVVYAVTDRHTGLLAQIAHRGRLDLQEGAARFLEAICPSVWPGMRLRLTPMPAPDGLQKWFWVEPLHHRDRLGGGQQNMNIMPTLDFDDHVLLVAANQALEAMRPGVQVYGGLMSSGDYAVRPTPDGRWEAVVVLFARKDGPHGNANPVFVRWFPPDPPPLSPYHMGIFLAGMLLREVDLVAANQNPSPIPGR